MSQSRFRRAAAPCLGLLLSLSATAAQADAAASLRNFLSEARTVTASFSQRLLDDKGHAVQESGGTFTIGRPGRFRWDYDRPYRQAIVADGRNLWIYDSDLAQVTVKPQDEALGNAPALMLSGGADVEKDFEITGQERRDGIEWITLKPRERDANFDTVRIGFQRGELAGMELVDGFQQVTAFRFSGVRRNVALPADAFRFTPPPGADVVGKPR